MEYFPTNELDDDNRKAEIDYLTRFLRGLLNTPDGTVNCAQCSTPSRVLVITTDSSFVCVPCAAAMDIVEHRDSGCYQIGETDDEKR